MVWGITVYSDTVGSFFVVSNTIITAAQSSLPLKGYLIPEGMAEKFTIPLQEVPGVLAKR